MDNFYVSGAYGNNGDQFAFLLVAKFDVNFNQQYAIGWRIVDNNGNHIADLIGRDALADDIARANESPTDGHVAFSVQRSRFRVLVQVRVQVQSSRSGSCSGFRVPVQVRVQGSRSRQREP